MGVEQDVYFVAVEGPRKNIVRMMNAALRKFEIQEPITEDDDIETINRKLEVFSGRDGKDIGISDLLEEDGLQEFRFREECLAWAEKQQEMFRQNASVKDHLPG